MSIPDKIEYFGKDLEAMSGAKHYHRWILKEFKPYLGNNVAEVGAGIGSFSKTILETGIRKLTAFEPSDNIFPLLQENLKQNPRAVAVHDYFGYDHLHGEFDSVIYVNVLEHVENDAEELSLARDALCSGGHVLILVPAFSWLYSEFDKALGHYRRYRLKPMKALAQDAGFSVIKAKYMDMMGVIPWYIHFCLLKNTLGSGQVALYDRLVIPIIRIFERIIPPPMGKNILIVGKKQD